MQITTIQGINSDNYDQPGFYYNLTSSDNAVTVLIDLEGNLAVDKSLQVSMDGNRWFFYPPDDFSANVYKKIEGITALRLVPQEGANFTMQISEYALPVRYMAVS